MFRTVFGTPRFLMAPMGPNGGGGVMPPVKPIDPIDTQAAFETIEAGMRDVTAGLRQAGSAHSSVADGLMAIKGRVSQLEGMAADLTQRLATANTRNENLGRIVSSHEIKLEENRRRLATNQATIADMTAANSALREEAIVLAMNLSAATESLDAHASRTETILTVIDDAKALTVETFSRADQASNMIAGAMQAINEIYDSLVPLFGAENPAVAKIREQATAIAGAQAAIEELLSSRKALADILNVEGDRPGLMDLRQLRKAMPLLEESSMESTKFLSNHIMIRLFARLATMFRNIDRDEASRRLNAFLDAASAVLARSDIPGATKTVYETLSYFLDLRIDDQDCRGFFYQMIRTANMLEAGRKLDSISAIVSDLDFQGWYVSGQEIRTRRMTSESEIDAIDGRTLIEFKTVWFGDIFGAYLARMLKSADSGFVNIARDPSDTQSGINHAAHAAKVANQMIRYRMIMDAGAADSLELHITSHTPVPDKMLGTLHDFFGKDRLKLFWYDKVLGNNSVLLAPEMRADSAPPAQTVAALQTAVEEPVQEEALAATDADLIATGTVEPEEQKIAATVSEQEDPETKAINEATSSFYESRLAGLLGRDTERIDRFVKWLVSSGRWHPISQVQKEERRGPMERLVHEWIKSHERSASTQPAVPWEEISASKAQNRFNRLFKYVSRKDSTIEWGQRVTQGVLNTDVIGVLAWIKDQELVASDQASGLSDMIGDFIAEIKEKYRPESYFKFDVDGDTLTQIMQRYVWLTER